MRCASRQWGACDCKHITVQHRVHIAVSTHWWSLSHHKNIKVWNFGTIPFVQYDISKFQVSMNNIFLKKIIVSNHIKYTPCYPQKAINIPEVSPIRKS